MPQSNKRPEREPEPAPDESVAEVLQNEQIVDLPLGRSARWTGIPSPRTSTARCMTW
jgi:hypothetical protein